MDYSIHSLPDVVPSRENPDHVTRITDALVTATERWTLADPIPPHTHGHHGAVYTSQGYLVASSVRQSGRGGNVWRSIDPPRIDAHPVRRLEGTWYYGGHWLGHFGHFLVETLPTMWAYGDGYDGIVVNPWNTRGYVETFKADLLRLLGVASDPVFADRAIAVEILDVPTRPSALNGWATPMAADLWQRIAKAACPPETVDEGSALVWLSRTNFEKVTPERPALARHIGGPELDETMNGLGFDVVYPETLSISEQIRTVRRARVLAGLEGSALHLSAFAVPGIDVVMIGSPNRPAGNPSQRAIDKGLRHRHHVIRYQEADGGFDVGAMVQDMTPIIS